MEKREKEGWPMEGAVQVIWEREDRTLALEGEPVLEYALSWPRIEGGGLGGAWISRYYARLAGCWRRRWAAARAIPSPPPCATEWPGGCSPTRRA